MCSMIIVISICFSPYVKCIFNNILDDSELNRGDVESISFPASKTKRIVSDLKN